MENYLIMEIKPPKTINEFKEIRSTLLALMSNPYCDHLMFMSLIYRLEKVEKKISELETK